MTRWPPAEYHEFSRTAFGMSSDKDDELFIEPDFELEPDFKLSPEELATAIKDIIQTLQVTDPKDMGKVIGAANKQLAGKSDGKSIAEMVKKVMSEI